MAEQDGELSVAQQETLDQVVDTLSIRDEVLDALLDKIGNDRYPSSEMMDQVERILPPWRKQDYADVLLDKLRSDKFPSHGIIERLLRLGS